MRIPGNMWVEVWQSARSVPVRRQKRLFDETKEAEKVKLVKTKSQRILHLWKLRHNDFVINNNVNEIRALFSGLFV